MNLGNIFKIVTSLFTGKGTDMIGDIAKKFNVTIDPQTLSEFKDAVPRIMADGKVSPDEIKNELMNIAKSKGLPDGVGEMIASKLAKK
jgi:hypothetical protein